MTNPFSDAAATKPKADTVSTVKNDNPYAASAPSGVSGVRMSDDGILNELLLVEPVEYIESILTSASEHPTDAFRVNIMPLTGELEGELQENVLIFQVALKRELKRVYHGPNRWLLARAQKGEKKPGKHAPYLFNPASEDDQAIYEKFKASQA